MLPILLLLFGATLITVCIKAIARWLIKRHTLEKVGYFAVITTILLLMSLKWLLYQQQNSVYLTYLIIGIVIGIIFGMVPKSNKFLVHKKEHWFMHAVTMYFLLVIYAFASLYFCIEMMETGSFVGYTSWNNFFEAIVEFLYLSIATFSTVGFGDICPVTTIAKLALCAEMLVMFRTLTIGALFITQDIKMHDTRKKFKRDKNSQED